MGAQVSLGLRAGFALTITACALLWSTAARAEPFQSGGIGAFLGYSVGERGGFEWGLEGFATRHLEHHSECNDHSARHGFGPVLRISAVKLSRLELTLAAHIAGELASTRSFAAINGELGASLFVEKNHNRVSPHSGVMLESLIFNVYFRQEWLEPSYSVGGGARYFPTLGTPGFCEF
jgi:hypothetical protein